MTRRQFLLRAGALGALPAFAALAAAGEAEGAPRNGYDLAVYVRPDGLRENYYAAGDDFLVRGLKELRSFWNEVAGSGMSLLRGHLDAYLPRQLRDLEHSGADAMQERFGNYVWDQRSRLSLVPYSYDTEYSFDPGVRMENKQLVDFPYSAAELLDWFPSNTTWRENAASICSATAEYMYYRGPGVYPLADVDTGATAGTRTMISGVGRSAKGMAVVTKITGDSSYLEAGDQKMDFVWDQRPNNLPLLVEEFKPTGYYFQDGPDQQSDTDTLYQVMLMYETWWLLDGDPAYQAKADKYRERALAVTDIWNDRGWMPRYGHFTRKMNFDGTAGDESIYGDGKFNTLWMLVWAYRATGDVQYLDRLKTAWNNLLEFSKAFDGLVDDQIEAGDGNDKLDEEQTIFLEILTFAYETSGDPEFLVLAERLAERILARGRPAMQTSDGPGPAFLRLALARGRVQRLEAVMGGRKRRLKVYRSGEKKPILNVTVPGDVALVHVPEGQYTLTKGR